MSARVKMGDQETRAPGRLPIKSAMAIAFRQRVERFLYLGLPFPHEPDQALTRGELAERIGVNPNWVTRNVPAYLFIDNRVHWHRYCRWRMKEQERLANEADGSPAIAPEAVRATD